jgi:DNA-binding NarL/FixJ family response regulator
MSHSVLIIEDDPLFRETFVEAIGKADGLILSGVADDLPEGLRLLEETEPDVLLVDIGLPSGSGIELIHKAHETLPNCDVMVVTVFGDERHVLECIEAGATGYLLKGSKDLEIINQINSLCGGGSPISPAIARQLLVRFHAVDLIPKQQLSANVPHLSEQERTVLEMSAKGYSYDETARLLVLSPRTIETYVKRIYRKLQVHSKSEAVYEARKLGLLLD